MCLKQMNLRTSKQKFKGDHIEVNPTPIRRPQGQKRARDDDSSGESNSSKRAETRASNDKQLMESFEKDIEYRLCNKIRGCIRDDGDLEGLRKKFQETTGLERGVKSDAEFKAGYEAGVISRFLDRKPAKNKKPYEHWNTYSHDNFTRLLDNVRKEDHEMTEAQSQNSQVSSSSVGSTEKSTGNKINQNNIRCCTASYRSILRKDLKHGIDIEINKTLEETLEQTTDYIIDYSVQVRKLMLLFNDYTFTVNDTNKLFNHLLDVLLKIHLAPIREKKKIRCNHQASLNITSFWPKVSLEKNLQEKNTKN
ncbi:hypothetical protein K501DRAFT_269137 [Backusella circina FSU 941]|nr:hypothetical protein K501DRAFT_269137 [Backusella circina FSU 941]